MLLINYQKEIDIKSMRIIVETVILDQWQRFS
jgi:hypothetical protein